jgi:hypothetical protein
MHSSSWFVLELYSFITMILEVYPLIIMVSELFSFIIIMVSELFSFIMVLELYSLASIHHRLGSLACIHCWAFVCVIHYAILQLSSRMFCAHACGRE